MLKFTFHHLKENKLKIFRWKLLHFILPCKQLLYQWKIGHTPLCDTPLTENMTLWRIFAVNKLRLYRKLARIFAANKPQTFYHAN